MKLIQSGPRDAKILIVGEAPGEQEATSGKPFIGQSGGELTKMLFKVGINRNDCFITNVCHDRPPENKIDAFFLSKTEARQQGIEAFNGKFPNPSISWGIGQLLQDIESIQPEWIIALGNTPLWALTGKSGIMSWRGSALTFGNAKLLPTIHPANILYDPSNGFLAMQDLRKVGDPSRWIRPEWSFEVRPHFDQVMAGLSSLLAQLNRGPITFACDIETRSGQIACIGIADTLLHAICIPLMCVERPEGYWSLQEEQSIVLKLRQVLTHSNAQAIFHNGAYDLQYFARQYGFVPNIAHDTMLLQHVLFSGMRKSLALCSSLYCHYHVYWKDDGKEWTNEEEDRLWSYNCEDCVRTLEIFQVMHAMLEGQGLSEQYHFQMNELFPQVLKMMLRGVKVDYSLRQEIDASLEEQIQSTQRWINTAVGHPLNVGSSAQMKYFFYTDLALPIRYHRKTHSPTLDDQALDKISIRNPLLRPLIEQIRNLRSLRVFLNTFVRAEVPPDGRMRCTYNMAGTETYRFSSSADAFGFGTNLQNIPSGDE